VALMVILLGIGLHDAAPNPAPTPASQPRLEPITPITAAPAASPAKLALGEALFRDPGLSHDRSRSCLTCHDTAANGADARRRDKALDGSDLAFNTDSVFNAALSFRLDWEGDRVSLEDQAGALIENPRIMGSTPQEAVARLKADPTMVARFREAYGQDPDWTSLLNAIATYERSLVTPGSRFDRWLSGEDGVLSVEEEEGYSLFESLGCVSCHQGVNVGGNLFARHGIFHPLAGTAPRVLRVPSLRNVATTPPYFHDGSAPTLADAVRMMALAQLDQTLSDQQTAALVAFLGSLTGNYRGQPVRPAQP
jgi:cytochrome c peroxidase